MSNLRSYCKRNCQCQLPSLRRSLCAQRFNLTVHHGACCGSIENAPLLPCKVCISCCKRRTECHDVCCQLWVSRVHCLAQLVSRCLQVSLCCSKDCGRVTYADVTVSVVEGGSTGPGCQRCNVVPICVSQWNLNHLLEQSQSKFHQGRIFQPC